jgi:hypothetical protein
MTSNFNQGLPCRVAADLRVLERRMDNSAAYQLRVEKIAGELAEQEISDQDALKALVYDYELDIFHALARALRNLDQACEGNQNAVNSVLDALAEMERNLLKTALEKVTDKAERLADQV